MIRFGYPAEPPTLDPLGPGGESAATRDILSPVLPSLFGLDESLQPHPELVESWPGPGDFSADPFSVRMGLREATWSDGRPITSGDVAFSLEQMREGPAAHRYELLQEVELLDDRTFRLVFDRPVRRWWSLFSLDDMVLPAHAYQPGDWESGPSVAGGPYLVEGWTKGLEVRLRRNEAYWGPPAILAGIDVQFVPDDETRFQLLEAGELDLFFSEGDSNIGGRAGARGLGPVGGGLDGQGGASGAWGPSWWELELDGSRLGRSAARAVVQALDPALAAEILEDSGRAMNGIPPRFPPGEGAAEPWDGRGSLEEARELLGTGSAPAFQLAFPRTGAAGGIARLAHFRLAEIGVRVELAGLRPEDFDRQIGRGRLEGRGGPAAAVLRLRRGADAPEAGLYGDSEDVLLAQSAISLDRLTEGPVVGLGAPAWLRVQSALAEEARVAPLVQVRTWLVGREGVSGPWATGTSQGPLWNAASWHSVDEG